MASRAKEKAKAKARETVTTAARQAIFPEGAPTLKNVRARVKDSRENLKIAVR